ncbi:skin secretory protein xP2 isoform X3 [Nothobranchius furzeri]
MEKKKIDFGIFDSRAFILKDTVDLSPTQPLPSGSQTCWLRAAGVRAGADTVSETRGSSAGNDEEGETGSARPAEGETGSARPAEGETGSARPAEGETGSARPAEVQ